jgi:hypothetical protein
MTKMMDYPLRIEEKRAISWLTKEYGLAEKSIWDLY